MNYTKWGFIIGTLLAIPGAITAVVTVPEIGCKVGWNPEMCIVQKQEVQLITQSETGEPLPGVKILFIAKGAPEVQYTDSNGYAKVQLPIETDVRVNLNKPGYPTQDFIINIKNKQDTVRTIRLSQSGQPSVEASPPPSPPPPPPSNPSTPPTPGLPPSPQRLPKKQLIPTKKLIFELQQCKRASEAVKCEVNITSQEKNRRLRLYTEHIVGSSSRVVDTQGNQYIANYFEFGGVENKSTIELNLVQGIPLKTYIVFDKIPPHINQFALLELSTFEGDSDSELLPVQFRTITIVSE
jgi:hypothetical protein